jgi:hypothetical protein
MNNFESKQSVDQTASQVKDQHHGEKVSYCPPSLTVLDLGKTRNGIGASIDGASTTTAS